MAEGYVLFDREVGVALSATVTGITNLTAATVTLLVDNGKSLSCTIVDAANRIVSHTVADADFDAGSYQGQFKVVQSGNTYYSDTFPVTVKRAIA